MGSKIKKEFIEMDFRNQPETKLKCEDELLLDTRFSLFCLYFVTVIRSQEFSY